MKQLLVLMNALIFSFLCVACGPAEVDSGKNKNPGNKPPKGGSEKPVTQEELTDLERVFRGLGRVEFAARLAAGENIRLDDLMGRLMAESMIKGNCTVVHRPVTIDNNRGLLQVAGKNCPLDLSWQANSRIKEMVSFVSEGQFKIQSQEMREQNEVQSMQYRINSTYTEQKNDLSSSTFSRIEGRINVTMTTNQVATIDISTDIKERTINSNYSKTGLKLITLRFKDSVVKLTANYNVYNSQDTTVYTLNNEKIPSSTFNAYLALLGMLKDAG